jgi:hypothetical protein
VNDLRKELSGVIVLSDERLDDFDDFLLFATRKARDGFEGLPNPAGRSCRAFGQTGLT